MSRSERDFHVPFVRKTVSPRGKREFVVTES